MTQYIITVFYHLHNHEQMTTIRLFSSRV